MSKNYVVVPSDFSPDNLRPEALEKVHMEGPDEHNSDIVVLENGIEKYRFPYRYSLARKFDAELPEVPVREHIGGGEYRERILGREERLPDIRQGAPPVYQFLYDNCSFDEGIEEDELIGLAENTWFKNIDVDLKKHLEKLNKKDILTYDPDQELWFKGPKGLDYYYDLGDEGYDISGGVYPVVRLIRDKASEMSGVTPRRIVSIISSKPWNFVTSREAGYFWVEHSLGEGYVRKVSGNMLEPHREL